MKIHEIVILVIMSSPIMALNRANACKNFLF